MMELKDSRVSSRKPVLADLFCPGASGALEQFSEFGVSSWGVVFGFLTAFFGVFIELFFVDEER
ncbi:MAG: hypothetical protein PHX83_06470 [Acidobacteriia bacterium]|nr:hypothetical protein [Terriglobia bacterium]